MASNHAVTAIKWQRATVHLYTATGTGARLHSIYCFGCLDYAWFKSGKETTMFTLTLAVEQLTGCRWVSESFWAGSSSKGMPLNYSYSNEIIGNLFALRFIYFLISFFRFYVDSIVPVHMSPAATMAAPPFFRSVFFCLHFTMYSLSTSNAIRSLCVCVCVWHRFATGARMHQTAAASRRIWMSALFSALSICSTRQNGVFGHNKRQSLPGERYSQFKQWQWRLHNCEFCDKMNAHCSWMWVSFAERMESANKKWICKCFPLHNCGLWFPNRSAA